MNRFAAGEGDDPVELIHRLIDERVTELKTFDAQVLKNLDPEEPESGRVFVLLPDLGSDPGDGFWADPRGSNSMIIPEIGDNVYVQFTDGDDDRPVYFGKSYELGSGVEFKGDPLLATIFESNLLKDTITHDDKTGAMKIDTTGLVTILNKLGVVLGKGAEPMVLGQTLFIFLTALVTQITAMATVFNAHQHPGVTPGPGVTGPPATPQVPPTPPASSILSTLNKLD